MCGKEKYSENGNVENFIPLFQRKMSLAVPLGQATLWNGISKLILHAFTSNVAKRLRISTDLPCVGKKKAAS